MVEIPKHLYDILISNIALEVARFGHKNPSYFEWVEGESSPYDFWKTINLLREISRSKS